MKHNWNKRRVETLLELIKSSEKKSGAFKAAAVKMKLKPASVRNYYYSGAWRKYSKDAQPPTIKNLNKFTRLEVLQFLRAVILGYSRGESFRSICLSYAKGNKAQMLRYQNKYRTVFSKNPDLVYEVMDNLKRDGYLVKNPLKNSEKKQPTQLVSSAQPEQIDNVITMPDITRQKDLSDQDIQNLFMGVVRLVRKQNQSQIEKMRVEIDRLTKMLRHTSEH